MNKKVMFWIVTGLFCVGTAISTTLYFLKAPPVVAGFHQLGYPDYFINLLGTAKVLGLLALLVPQAPRTLREWAYAGFTIDSMSAVWSGLAMAAGPGVWVPPLLFTGLSVASYLLRRKTYPAQMLQPPANSARAAHA